MTTYSEGTTMEEPRTTWHFMMRGNWNHPAFLSDLHEATQEQAEARAYQIAETLAAEPFGLDVEIRWVAQCGELVGHADWLMTGDFRPVAVAS